MSEPFLLLTLFRKSIHSTSQLQLYYLSFCGMGMGLEPITMRNLHLQHIVLLCPSSRPICGLHIVRLPILLPNHLVDKVGLEPTTS